MSDRSGIRDRRAPWRLALDEIRDDVWKRLKNRDVSKASHGHDVLFEFDVIVTERRRRPPDERRRSQTGGQTRQDRLNVGPPVCVARIRRLAPTV